MHILKKLLEHFRKPRVFFTADLHFGHRRILEYCLRPWADKDEMNEGLVALWNAQVGTKDIVYVLGDFSLDPKLAAKFAPRLNGKKILICGNHDACFDFPNSTKADRMREKYLSQFAEVHMELQLTLKNKTKVLLAHMPYVNDETLKYDTRYLNMRPIDNGEVLLHGHLHGRYVKSGKMIDVGIDGSLTLYTQDDIIKLLNDTHTFIPSRLTEHYITTPQRTGMKGESL